MLKHVDLCSGIGGFALGFEWAGLSRPVMFCDIEPWSRKILAKHWSDVPIEEDVKVLANEPERIPELGRNSILTAGYPCQPFSQAGKRRGEEDDRHIWPYIREIVAHKRPTWCVFENVYGHVSMGIDTVLSNLETDGYATKPFIVPACGVDAPHRRNRIWIISRFMGDTDSKRSKVKGQHQTDATESLLRGSDARGSRGNDRWEFRASPNEENVGDTEDIGRDRWTETTGREGQTHKQDEPRLEIWGEPSRPSEDVSDSASQRLEGRKRSEHEGHGERFAESGVRAGGFWAAEPSVGRVANGIPRRVDRIKGLGNAIVPQIAMQIGLTIKNCHEAMGG